MLVPIILGADKTTVSVATGHVEYHPLYLSIGNISNAARRAHRNAVIPIGFLAIPKCECYVQLLYTHSIFHVLADRKYDNDSNLRIFKKRLYHSSISAILQSLKPGMTIPVIRKCPDGHFRRLLYELAAFIADYPEQVYLSGIVSGWCGRYVSILSSDTYPLTVCEGARGFSPILMVHPQVIDAAVRLTKFYGRNMEGKAVLCGITSALMSMS